MANLTIHVNTDTQDLPLNTSGVDWTEINPAVDQFIFTAGSDTVKDGEPIPSESDLNQAGVEVGGSEITISKYFLADNSANELKEIHNMGNQNKRYVLAFDFDDDTASEPVLEIWDDSDLETIESQCLGGGAPLSSWFRGITTTSLAPGESWVGSKLAGSSTGYFLWLNDQAGALTEATTLYCNLKVVIPASVTTGLAENPVIAVKYLSN